jgi:hypothetical protein
MGKKPLPEGLPFFSIITLTLSILRSTERSDAKIASAEYTLFELETFVKVKMILRVSYCLS